MSEVDGNTNMIIGLLVTNEIATGERELRFLDYSLENGLAIVLGTHAAVWDLNSLRRVEWEDFTNNHQMPRVVFQDGHHLLTLSAEDGTWQEIR